MAISPTPVSMNRQDIPPEVRQRRELQSATLLNPDGNATLYDGDLGSRLANVVYATNVNMGFDEFSAQLLAQDGGSLIPFAEAHDIFDTWDFAYLRYSLCGETVWCGKLWQPAIGGWYFDEKIGPCVTMTLSGMGLLEDMTNRLAHVSGDYADEFATLSVTQLARDFMKQDQSLLFRKPLGKAGYGQMMTETSINIATGGISSGFTDYPKDMLLNALKAGSGAGLEYWMGVFEPELGFWIQLRDGGPVRWHLPMSAWRGQIVKNLHEYANRVIALYTDGENSNIATEWTAELDASIAALQHNNVTRERTITIDRVGADGAAAGRDTFLLNHKNPIGFQGSFIFSAAEQGGLLIPVVPNQDDAPEPCTHIRCGQQATIPEMLPFDPNTRSLSRNWMIESTSHDVDNGTFTITLDQRQLRSRDSEQPRYIAATLHALEPAMSRKFKTTRTSFNHSIINRNTDAEISGDSLNPELLVTWSPVRNATARIRVALQAEPESGSTPSGTDTLYWGFSLDDENFDKNNEDRTATISWPVGSIDARLLDFSWSETLTAEPHTIRFWFRPESGDTNYDIGQITVSVED